MKYLFVILAVAAAIIWYQRIQRDLATWQTSVQSLVAATHPEEGMAASPEDQATLVALDGRVIRVEVDVARPVGVQLGQFISGGQDVFPLSGLVQSGHFVDECAESLG